MARPVAELKTKLRKLKKLETRLRFGSVDPRCMKPALVFDEFFSFSNGGRKAARYGLDELSRMERAEFQSVIESYMAEVYFRVYGFREDDAHLALNAFELPFGADEDAIKKRFRELAKKYHPDTGGDAAKFIELKSQYDALIKNV